LGLLLSLVGASGFLGCAAPTDPLARETAPPRFAVDLTVLAEEEIFEDPEPPVRGRRPARYVVEADRGLHAGEGRGVTPEYYPPLTRRLTKMQMDELWRVVRDSPIPADATTERAGTVFAAAPDQPVAKLGLVLEHKWVYVETPLDGATPQARAVESLADYLAELAWVEE